MHGAQVRSLVGELRTHMLLGQKTENKTYSKSTSPLNFSVCCIFDDGSVIPLNFRKNQGSEIYTELI